ncbi:MAG: FAD:protein FMN transferase [Lachnospiraceae bacterium]|nr:FAD:protein FMN transferase [Lachnospiraceae bacterium]
MIHSVLFKGSKKYIASFLSGILTCGLLSACGRAPVQTSSAIVMDTVFTVTVYGDEIRPAELLDAGTALDENVLSRYSDKSLLNLYMNEGVADLTYDLEGYVIDLNSYLDRCDEIRDTSAGAFDVHIGALCDLWNIEGAVKGESEFALPSENMIRDAMENANITDLGSVGKGIYLDLIKEKLDENNVQGAVISAGGSILVYGSKDDGAPFKVGIKDPFETSGQPFGIIELKESRFVSTSGSYERFFESGGVRYHHILDPMTGYPAWTPEDIKGRQTIPATALSSPYPYGDVYPVSVTVIADEGFISDALSTACFVMGPGMGIGYAEKYGAEVIYVMNDGTYITSDGIMASEEERLVFRLD